jgi:hypothetical protein
VLKLAGAGVDHRLFHLMNVEINNNEFFLGQNIKPKATIH